MLRPGLLTATVLVLQHKEEPTVPSYHLPRFSSAIEHSISPGLTM